MPTPLQALEGSIAKVGTQRAFAAELSRLRGQPLNEVNVSQWRSALRKGKAHAIPHAWCEPIETLVGGAYRVEELRPDVLWKRDADGRVISTIHPIEPTTSSRRSRAKTRRP